MDKQPVCELCKRPDQKLTKHHLIPRARHRKKSVKNQMSLEEARSRVLWVCRSCHNQIHAVLSEKELEQEYNTLDKLLAHPDMATYVEWIRSRNVQGRVAVRRPKRK